MQAVESLDVHAVDVPHQPRQIGLARVQHKVIVVVDQTVRQHLRVKAIHRLSDDFEQRLTVSVSLEDRLTPVPTRRHW
jgi:hypothetical protein